MAVIAAAGVIVFLIAHRGREIGEHLVDNEIPGPPARPRTDAVRPVSGA